MKTKLIIIVLTSVLCALNFKWELIFDVLAIILHAYLKSFEQLSDSDKEIAYEATLEATALIKMYGYPAENHTVLTKDGFILTLHRIPFGKRNTTAGGIPIFLQHGIMCCSPQWIGSKESSLGFVLADNGYDVWLGNFRASRYSRHHLYLSEKSQEYWRFGWDKLAKYDIPAMIDYIRFNTGYDKILVIGHSMGFTTMAAALASQPKLNNKVIGLVGLGAVAHGHYITSLIRYMELIIPFLKFTPTKIFYPNSKHWEDIMARYCVSSAEDNACASIFSAFVGYNPENNNQSRMPIHANHCLCGLSMHVIYHWSQTSMEYDLRGYDYGKKQNRIEYGEDYPTSYNISKVRVPVALLHSINDAFSTTVENVIISRNVPLLLDQKMLPGTFTAHFDYFTLKKNEANVIILQWLQQMLTL